MNFRQILEYYSRDDISQMMLEASANREFVGSVRDGGYLKRPSSIQYAGDIAEMVRRGAVAFHMSVERWDNPSIIGKGASRIGWDLLIDIDARFDLADSIETAKLIIKFLKSYGIDCYGIKFSGRRGFHIIVPFEAFPDTINYRPVKDMYPELHRIVVSFIRRQIYDELADRLVKRGGIRRLLEAVDEIPDDIDPFLVVGMNPEEKKGMAERVFSHVADAEKDWSSRHLFRAPYSLNHKTWLVSLPIKDSMIGDFSLEMARPENVRAKEGFIPGASGGEATSLFVDAADWWGREIKRDEKPRKRQRRILARVPEERFPPCIKNILSGLDDGRKRSLFTLITFLKKMNWTHDEIEKRLLEWNKRNKKPLSERMIRTQIRWHENKDLMPANCESDMFYHSIGVCTPDARCRSIKNPVSYPVPDRNVCRECGRKFGSARSLRIHVSKSHKV